MDFKQFNLWAIGDSMALITALELLIQNGRKVIQAKEATELVVTCAESLSGYGAESKLYEVVAVSKELATLEPDVLISYIQRSRINVNIPGAEESGICPMCGGELKYGDEIAVEDESGYYKWTCSECGATGKEIYDKVFDRHYEVKDKDGKPHLPSP